MNERSEISLRGLTRLLRSLDLGETEVEVRRESCGRIVLAGLRGTGKSTLYNRLHGWDVSPVGAVPEDPGEPVEEVLGLFTLLDLPERDGTMEPAPFYEPYGDPEGWNGAAYDTPMTWRWHAPSLGMGILADADLVVFMVDAASGLRPEAYRWFCRIRATGRPVLVALNKVDRLDGNAETVAGSLRRRLAVPVVPISAQEGTNVLEGLLPQMAELCPALVVPLGRELAAFRRTAARHLIGRAALTCGLLGAEPVPLLDVPFQLVTEVRLVMRLVALYGRSPGQSVEGAGRELLMTLAVGLALSALAEQGAKLVPMLGWLLSGLLSATSTWLIGWAAVVYFERAQAGVEADRGEPVSSRWRERVRALTAPAGRGLVAWRRRRARRGGFRPAPSPAETPRPNGGFQ